MKEAPPAARSAAGRPSRAGGPASSRSAGASDSNGQGLLPLHEIEIDARARLSSGMSQLDLVLGGGLVAGSFILIAGEPGIGKSTLLLEIARNFSGPFFYFSGEESSDQIKLRAERMGVDNRELFLSSETDLDEICNIITRKKPAIVCIDSIQTVRISGSDAGVGGQNLLRLCSLAFMEAAKSSRTPLIVTGHITKDGSVAGPRLMEHMTDAVLYFESDRLGHLRLLRSIKNRFGPTGEVGIFEMGEKGLREPSLLGPRSLVASENEEVFGSGRVYTALLEGSRAIGAEVQALVNRTPFGQTRRMAEGLDNRRLVLLAAVLEKYLRVNLAEYDIFANLAGGLSSDEPALDLAVCAAILSSYREVPLDRSAAFFGEVGLSGEVRPVGRAAARVKELTNLGFRKFFVPEANLRELKGLPNIEGRSVGRVADLLPELEAGTDSPKGL